MRLYVCLLIGSLVASSAHADSVSFDTLLGPGAMICDEQQSVVQSLINNQLAPDCGIFEAATGTPVTVTILGKHSDKPLAMFEFHIPMPWGNQVQYGWWAGELPAAYIPGVEA